MSRILFLIGTGGFLGSMARYLTASTLTRYFPAAFPYGTFVANSLGCLIIGIVYGLSERFNWFTPEWRFFLATGFCGGYTTFSSFAFENIKLLQDGNYITFASYSLISFIVGLLTAFIGLSITKI
jgi:CrcB protein